MKNAFIIKNNLKLIKNLHLQTNKNGNKNEEEEEEEEMRN
jgi:hypothetical protein